MIAYELIHPTGGGIACLLKDVKKEEIPEGTVVWLIPESVRYAPEPPFRPREVASEYDEEAALTDYLWTHYRYLLPPEHREKAGIEAARRLLADHREEIVVNRCPRCRRIVRTPKAKLCLWCGYSWHHGEG